MLNTLGTVRNMTDARQAEAIAEIFREFAERQVTPEMLQAALDGLAARLRAEMAVSRAEMQGEVKGLRADLRGGLKQLRGEMGKSLNRAPLLQTFAIAGLLIAIARMLR